jgi:glycosyltransferase involved in cell wall biosynthesis
MRVLWFTGVQLPAVTGQGLSRAGWQEGLRKALEENYPELELLIASFGDQDYLPFQDGNSVYYNILRDRKAADRWERLINNWKHSIFSHQELDRCRELVEQINPDLVFMFGTENPFGLIADQIKPPVIISIQAVLNGLIKHLFDGLTNLEKIKILLSRETLLGGGVFHKYLQLQSQIKMESEIYRRCNYFEGRTEWDREWQNQLNPDAKYFKIHRVLGEKFYSAVWEQEKSQPYQLYTTSSNASFKGGISLVRAVIELQKRGIQDLTLRIAGVHPRSATGSIIRELIEKHDLQNNISLLGRISPDEIVLEMKRAAIFILPSHMDNSPNSLGEAMLMGMPCIASSAGGIESMLENRQNGLIYDPDNIVALADCIEELISQPAFASDLGHNAFITARERHEPKKIAEDTYQMYRQVLIHEGIDT